MESESESGGKESGGGDANNGDRGGGREKDKGSGADFFPSVFVFGSSEKQKGKMKNSQGSLNRPQRRNTIPPSYKDKLLSLGSTGYLMKHDEKDDIVNGWKAYFRSANEKELKEGSDESIEDGDSEGEETDRATTKNKFPTLQVTAQEYAAWCSPWLNSLIVKLLGSNISKAKLEDRIRRMWKPQQPLKVLPLNNGYFIISFTSEEDKDYAFQEGPWMIDDHYLLVQRWHPNFNPWKADLQKKIAVWIRIPDLPVELYGVESLKRIGNMVGKTLKIDRSTSIYDKGGFTRICVEIDLEQPLLPLFNAFGEERPIAYEGLHLVCFRCGRYGHHKEQCLKLLAEQGCTMERTCSMDQSKDLEVKEVSNSYKTMTRKNDEQKRKVAAGKSLVDDNPHESLLLVT